MAGRVQLELARGPQERFFTVDPEYTHFRSIFKKTTNYAVQSRDFEPQTSTRFGETAHFRIPANYGDLLKTVALKVTLSELNHPDGHSLAWIDSIGHGIIEYVDLRIGDVVIQRLTSDVLQIYSEQSYTQTKQQALKHLIGKYPNRVAGTLVSDKSIAAHLGEATGDTELIIDLPFYFYRKPELALPLCALKLQEVEFVVKLRHYQDAVDGHLMVSTVTGGHIDFTTSGGRPTIKSMALATDIVFVEDAVRDQLLRRPELDYVITQHQRHQETISAGTNALRMKLEFSNPMRELYFVIRSRVPTGSSPFDYDNRVTTPNTGEGKTTGIGGRLILFEHLRHLKLSFDGEEILDEVTGKAIFLKAVQPYMHHSKTQLIRRFYSYAFATEPEGPPSGTVNLSLIKDQIVQFELNPQPTYARDVRVYGASHNVLRFSEGKADILYQYTP